MHRTFKQDCNATIKFKLSYDKQWLEIKEMIMNLTNGPTSILSLSSTKKVRLRCKLKHLYISELMNLWKIESKLRNPDVSYISFHTM